MDTMNRIDFTRPNWADEAACKGMDPKIFFPERGASVEPARKVCASCPVRVTCAQYAIDNADRYGIWGGLSEKKRRKIRMGRDFIPGEA